MKHSEIKEVSMNMVLMLGLDPLDYLTDKDKTLGKRTWEYLEPLATKIIETKQKQWYEPIP